VTRIPEHLVIRKAGLNEYEILTSIAMQSKAFWGYDESFMQQCANELLVTEAQLQKQQNYYKVAELNRQVVGFYAVRIESEVLCELDALFVLPNYMGEGVGSELLKNATALARSLSARSLKIVSDPNAKDFYLKAGAIVVGEERSSSMKGRQLPLLALPLT